MAYFIAYLFIDYADMCSVSERKLVSRSVIDETPVATCHGPMTNGSQYIEGYADGCSFNPVDAVSFIDCSSHCILDFQCKAMKYSVLNQCNLCFPDSETSDGEVEGNLFVETGMFGLYIDGNS